MSTPNPLSRLILVIDDDCTMQQLFTFVLQKGAVQVKTASHAEQARHLLAEREPDLILVDIHLNDSDGLALAQELNHSLGYRVPIVAVSASSDSAAQERARLAGCAGFLAKPINTRTFATDVAEHMAGPAPAACSKPPLSAKAEQLRTQFLDTALQSLQELGTRPDDCLLVDTLLADCSHRWTGASGICGLPDIESAARAIEDWARHHSPAGAAQMREKLHEIKTQLEETRRNTSTHSASTETHSPR